MIRAVTTNEPEPEPRRTRRSTFREWHRTEQLWREIYTRTVSALIAATVIYLVAAVSGVVTRKPLPVVAALAGALCLFAAWSYERARRQQVPDAGRFAVYWFVGAALVFVAFAIAAWVKV